MLHRDFYFFARSAIRSAILRFPAFFMGMLGGILVHRLKNSIDAQNAEYVEDSGLHKWSLCHLFSGDGSNKNSHDGQAKATNNPWKKRVDLMALMYIIMQAPLIFVDILCKVDRRYETKLVQLIFLRNSNLSEQVLQYALAYTVLVIIVGLCMDNQESTTSSVLRTPTLLFFGRISMPLYILQAPILHYLKKIPVAQVTHGGKYALRFLTPTLFAFILQKLLPAI